MAAYTTIDDPSSVFQCTLYSGNAGTQTITHGGDSDLQADLVWLKGRNHAESHFLTDSVRGVNSQLYTNGTNAEGTETNVVTAIGSDSFNIGNYSDINTSGKNYVSWNFKETAGMFDIVAYTGNDTTRTISHSLGVIPKMIWVKERANANSWHVYNETLGNTKHLYLNTTHAAQTSSAMWNDTSPTSSVFTVSGETQVNRDGGTIIAYLFGDKQGVSKVGSYIGNGNADGTFVYTGFKPAFVLIKITDNGSQDWFVLDNKRSPSNLVDDSLAPNQTDQEYTSEANLDFTAQGFKLRMTSIRVNGSGNNYIYMAFAEQPFVTSTGVPATAR